MSSGELVAGRFRLEERIGRGGDGDVWRAVTVPEGDPVALKCLRLEDLDGGAREHARTRLLAEADVAKRLVHPHIITVHELVESDGDPWLVMDHIDAPDLAQVIAGRTIDPTRAAAIGVQVAGALAYAHGSDPSVVHGAVSPHNILVGDDDHVTLVDFGISPVGRSASAVACVPPEVANEVRVGPRTDVFGLGATLYVAVEGCSPWGTGDREEMLAAAKRGVVDPPRRAGALGPVLERMLRRRPQERPGATTVTELLRQVATTEEPPPRERTSRSWLPRGTRRGVLAAAALTAVAAVVAVGLLAWLRPPASTIGASLAAVDACGTLDAHVVPGLQPGVPDPAPGWGCTWAVGDGRIRIERRTGPDQVPGGVPVEVGGHAATAVAGGPAACSVTVGRGVGELLVVEVTRPAPQPDPCAPAIAVANAAVARLF